MLVVVAVVLELTPKLRLRRDRNGRDFVEVITRVFGLTAGRVVVAAAILGRVLQPGLVRILNVGVGHDVVQNAAK